MLVIAFKLLAILLLVVACGPALLIGVRRLWPRARPSELALTVGLLIPLLLILEVALLGSVPSTISVRPLDGLLPLHLLLAAASLGWAWLQRRRLQALRARAAVSWRAARRLAPLPLRLLLLAALLWHALIILYGAWNWSSVVDDLQYHLPQALQPFQDGRLGTVRASVPWADGYPRAAALLWAWSMIIARTDAVIHPINGCCGLLIMLSALVAARRLGVGRDGALLAAALIPTAPIYSYLTTITYSDLVLGAFLAAAFAFALPERDPPSRTPLARPGPSRWSTPSACLCGLALAMTLWVKFNAAPAVALIALYRLAQSVLDAQRAKHSPIRPQAPRLSLQFAIAALCLLAASAPYLKTWLVYGSPFYPLNVRFGPWVLFAGPLDVNDLGAASQMPWLTRFVRFWSDWLAQLGPETPGSFGPLFTLLLLPPSAALALSQLARPWGKAEGPRGLVLPALLLALVLLTPLYNWPRYAVWLLAPMSAAAAYAFANLASRKLQTGFVLVALLLALANAALFGRFVLAELSEAIALAGDRFDLLTPQRNRVLVDAFRQVRRDEPSPAARAKIRALARPGETIVSAVQTEPVLLMDADYSSIVDHRPAASLPSVHSGQSPTADPARGAAEALAWLARLQAERVAVVVVYAGLAEDRVLAEPDSGYALAFVDRPARSTAVEHPVCVYLRADLTPRLAK